ncbi:MAG: methylenetetrahydrofolate reductase, partial [Woeseiaceae bacterium]|nr:methylenetetrahydrofolate reductase [Woeseiaceae bacterium]
MTPADTLLDKLKRRDFVITAEIAPRLTADRRVIAEQVAPLKGRVDAINVTDCAGARVTMSSLGAAALLVAEGVEPIMHVTCRDRNRIALAADLVAASALGIRNLLILTGDDPRTGDEPDARPVYDLDAAGLTRLARRLGKPGVTPSGRPLGQPAA